MMYLQLHHNAQGPRPARHAPLVRSLLAVGLLAAAVSASGQSAGAARFKAIDDTTVGADARQLLSVRSERPVRMVLIMSQPSVAAARESSPTRRIDAGERAEVTRLVRAQHAAVKSSIEWHGAKVLQQYHGALNGIKVDVKASKIEALRALPGVVAVLPVAIHKRDNAVSVPYIGAPTVWQGAPGLAGLRGEGVKVAVIDSGIDYTHANFGGPGTVAAYNLAAANSTGAADPSLFGPNAPKVKGGIDLVGDAYDASVAGSVPVPDPNPLDCAVEGHGSHVAGTIAGFGVTPSGATYRGPFVPAAYTAGAFRIGPGVAPLADLYAVRVFGCVGSTDVVVEAIDWAVNNDMDVINMSLGSPFGTGDTADARAATAAVRAGVVVVASAGNAGPAPYIQGSPASGDGVISVAAIDGRPTFPGAIVTLNTGGTFQAQNSNGAALPAGSLPIVVLRNANGTVSLGCNPAEYAGTAGKLVVTLRGTCARVDRATFGQAAGAAAVAMINNGAGLPPFEGTIAGVTIPFLGVQTADAAALTAATAATLNAVTLNNAFAGTVASFSSGGPRVGDSAFKPSISAPGVSTFSTLVASGAEGEVLSGTSMAAPHVAGVAALTVQAHPGWSAQEISAAVAQTASPGKLSDYSARLEGAGLVQPAGATATQSVLSVEGDRHATALSFGFAEFTRDFRGERTLRVRNKGSDIVRFNLTSAPAAAGAPHTLRLSRSTITVGPRETAEISVQLSVPASTVGDSSDFREVAGLVTLTPTSARSNAGVALSVPYYLVPRSRSKLEAEIDDERGSQVVKLSNGGAVVAANADFYALGLRGTRQGAAPFDVRAVGVQSFPLSATTNLLVFAVNTFDRFSAASVGEVDILIDSNGDGVPDFDVFSVDFGLLTTGSFDGQPAVGVLNLNTGAIRIRFFTDAPTDGSTLLLPVRTSDIGLSSANPRFSYAVQSFNLFTGGTNTVPGVARFNAFQPAIGTGDFVTLAPGARASVPVVVNPAEFALTPPLGVMVVDKESPAGSAQATLLRLGRDR